MQCDIPAAILPVRPGRSSGALSPRSHFNDPLGPTAQGNSRRWGDAPEQVQRRAVAVVRAASAAAGFSLDEIAFAIAVARLESGFNPDAAARASSASGLGQIIDGTAWELGLPSAKRFSLRDNAAAMIRYLKNALSLVDQRAGRMPQEERLLRAYGVYHDGPASRALWGAGPGYEIGVRQLLPRYSIIREWLLRCP